MSSLLCTRCKRDYEGEETVVIFDPISRKYIEVKNEVCPSCNTDSNIDDDEQ